MRGSELPIQITPHAWARMKRNGISPAQIEATVRKPELHKVQKDNGRSRFERRFGRKTRVVVVAEEFEGSLQIVTCFKL